MKKYLLFIITVLMLSGCAQPLPEDKLNYAGEWQSPEMRLLILADGSVAYKRFKGGHTHSIEGPLKEFIGDDFVVGFSFLTTTFKVSKPPHKVNEVWKMTVDGVELSKVR